ncbi:ABC transporter ATP-binding protein [Geomonas oryzisoli]|uniref:ABC transporter ATP-binding protein n=1 Tax=Geomonas oryzisoli TaxID=2847992 RepID=A0ABX8JEE8_9BACT|nr:ABC transporter ATP-binding protein [Geomonas oryzisoli]QWV95067.1 ABC transporter ATP-binding protein [Geomonas oryzisoli]
MASVITVENLGKKYLLNRQAGRQSYVALRDVLAEGAKNAGRRLLGRGGAVCGAAGQEDFWALRDVCFEVKQGERVGIVGRNGAGKSTLLKILSRITPPTTGSVRLRGRVASLLEVGTGFHPELTGRENIYLNGAILGMGRSDVRRKFDEIVAFAEVEKFLDTPVKRYSSGMYVRLAFAVAAHLEPEILIVDEVLAVGDTQFQRKCLGRMEQAGRDGRTVLFVSHNMAAVRELCSKAIVLSAGRNIMEGGTDEAITTYLNSLQPSARRDVIRSKCDRFELKMPYWVNRKGEPVTGYRFGDDCILRFEFNFLVPVRRINPGFAVREAQGRRIFTSHLLDDGAFAFPDQFTGKVVIDTDLNLCSIAPGTYEVVFGVRDENEQNVLFSEGELWLEINRSGPAKNGAEGVLWHTSSWQLQRDIQ